MTAGPTDTARIFLGVWPDAQASRALARLDPWLSSLADYRVTPGPQRHLTVAFLGDTPREFVEALCESVVAACASTPAFSAPVSGVSALPSQRSPRVIAVDLEGESGLTALIERLRAAAADAAPTDDLERDMARPPRPHITVARLRRGRRSRGLELHAAPRLSGALETGSVRVVESRLSREGPEYRTLCEAPLGSRT